MTGIGPDPLGRVPDVLSGRPELLERLETLVRRVEDGRLDRRILGLCRRRVGTLLGCPAHRGVIPARDRMDDRERACVDFAEQFVLAHHDITDDDARRVTSHLSDAEMVALTTALAVYDGFCRFEIMFSGG
ncbi:MAG TPA: hypothetical protein VFN68_16055 [Acidimicrobiales bacterium]|nr:hypothetical protein [Acidimicrobiales bacterium]